LFCSRGHLGILPLARASRRVRSVARRERDTARDEGGWIVCNRVGRGREGKYEELRARLTGRSFVSLAWVRMILGREKAHLWMTAEEGLSARTGRPGEANRF
jgi:hypothetical protein